MSLAHDWKTFPQSKKFIDVQCLVMEFQIPIIDLLDGKNSNFLAI